MAPSEAAAQTPAHRALHWKDSFVQDVADDAYIEAQLLALAFAAGINDATTFPDYRIFVSNQTGNTALLAIGTLGIGRESVDLPNVALSLSLFIAAGLIFGQVGDRLGRRRKAWLLTTNILQTALMFAAAALRKWLPEEHEGPHAWAVIVLLAFASGGQVAMARTVNLPQIPTAMVTSAYIDLFADPDIFAFHNRPRNRRFLFIVSLVVGSFVGAAAYATVEPALPLLLASLCKTAVCISFLFNQVISPCEVNEAGEPIVEESAPA